MEQKPHWKPVLDWANAVTVSERIIDAIGTVFFIAGLAFLFLSFSDYSLAIGSQKYVPWLQRVTGWFPDMEGLGFVVSQMFSGVICFIISIVLFKRTRILQG